jgi:hypothetical protein
MKNEKSILWSVKMLHKDYTASVQLENKNYGRGSQGACSQDDLIVTLTWTTLFSLGCYTGQSVL